MNLTEIILIIVAIIVGYVLGIIDGRVTTSLRNKGQDKNNPTPAESTDAATDALPQPDIDEKKRLGEHTVIKVTIDQALELNLELDGIRQEDPAELNAEQRQRLINIIMQIKPWIDGKNAPTSASLAISMPEPPTSQTVKPILPSQSPQVKPSAPKLDILRGMRSLLDNEIKKPVDKKSTSIVAMIDDVLQAKLLGTSLAARRIRLEEGSTGGVVVFVDSNRYNSMDEVPEPEVRAIIKAAISDWEKR